jgi:hypothetical protein
VADTLNEAKMASALIRAVVIGVAPLVFPILSVAADVPALQIRGKSIKVGDTADHVFSVLKKDEMLRQDVARDPKNPNSLVLTKHYKADGKSFSLAFARQRDPGPYVVTKIVVDQPNVSSPSRALAVSNFERGSFFQKHRLVRKDEWALRLGGKNFYYSFADPENADSDIGVELSSNPADVRKIAVSWHGTATKEPARFTRSKERFLRDLLAATFSDVEADTLIAYARAQHGKRYPGVGDTIPRKALAGANVYSGAVGEALIVGIER